MAIYLEALSRERQRAHEGLRTTRLQKGVHGPRSIPREKTILLAQMPGHSERPEVPAAESGLCQARESGSAKKRRGCLLVVGGSDRDMTEILGYLASPYTARDADGLPDIAAMERRYVEACLVAGALIAAGFRLYCPIAHTHPIAVHCGMPLESHDLWLPADRPFLERCDELWIAMMSGWQASYGVNHEAGFFRERGRPVYLLNPHDPVGSLRYSRAGKGTGVSNDPPSA